MTDQILQTLSSRLLQDEKQYQDDNDEVRGSQKVLRGCRLLDQVAQEKAVKGEPAPALGELLQKNQRRLNDVMRDYETSRTDEIDYDEWANEIHREAGLCDALNLSFDTPAEIESRLNSPRSMRRSDAASSKGASMMMSILKSNGKLSENADSQNSSGEGFFWITTAAWGLAVIGMTITIGFLAADFWSAQKNVAIQIERSDPTPLELPAITICTDLQNVPSFVDFPSAEYPGLPLFGISKYLRVPRGSESASEEIVHPNTLPSVPGSPIEDVIVSEDSQKCSIAGKGFDVRREMESLNWIRTAGYSQGFTSFGDSCLHCFRIGFKKRELLQPYNTQGTAMESPSVQLRIFRSRLFEGCQAASSRLDPLINFAFASELFEYSEQLEKRGILNFNGNTYDVLKKPLRGQGVSQHIDFYCNVYFFSGFFYPSLDNASISYRYERDSKEIWMKTGAGPYYTAYSWPVGSPLAHGPDIEVLERDTYSLHAIRVFAEEPSSVNTSRAVLPQTGISVLGTQSSIYTFKKVKVRGKIEYRTREGKTERNGGGGWRVVQLYHIGFDFGTFETEEILEIATMSWPEFLTDVFEFVGLFTGVCIFTLIVAPAHSFGIGGSNL